MSHNNLSHNRTEDRLRDSPHNVLSRMQRMIDDAHFRNETYCNKKRDTYQSKIADINYNLGVLAGPMPRPVYWKQK